MKSAIGSLICGFVFVAIGLVICVFELSNYTFVTSLDQSQFKAEEATYTYSLYDDSKVELNITDTDYEIIKDESLNNEMIVKVKYLDEFESIHINKDLDSDPKRISIDKTVAKHINISNIFNKVIKDLKDKKIYSYDEGYNDDIQIIINPKDLNKVRID